MTSTTTDTWRVHDVLTFITVTITHDLLFLLFHSPTQAVWAWYISCNACSLTVTLTWRPFLRITPIIRPTLLCCTLFVRITLSPATLRRYNPIVVKLASLLVLRCVQPYYCPDSLSPIVLPCLILCLPLMFWTLFVCCDYDDIHCWYAQCLQPTFVQPWPYMALLPFFRLRVTQGGHCWTIHYNCCCIWVFHFIGQDILHYLLFVVVRYYLLTMT